MKNFFYVCENDDDFTMESMCVQGKNKTKRIAYLDYSGNTRALEYFSKKRQESVVLLSEIHSYDTKERKTYGEIFYATPDVDAKSLFESSLSSIFYSCDILLLDLIVSPYNPQELQELFDRLSKRGIVLGVRTKDQSFYRACKSLINIHMFKTSRFPDFL